MPNTSKINNMTVRRTLLPRAQREFPTRQSNQERTHRWIKLRVTSRIPQVMLFLGALRILSSWLVSVRNIDQNVGR
jgi:hypothetical protein